MQQSRGVLAWRRVTIPAAVVACAIVYVTAAALIRTEKTDVALLQPGNSTTPLNSCDKPVPGLGPLPPDTLKVLVGNNAIARSIPGKFTALSVGACRVLAFERNTDGVIVDANFYGEGGNLIRINNFSVR